MSPREGSRLDAVLVERGFVSGREKAKELIVGGLVRVNGHPAAKPAQLVKEADAIDCDTRSLLYVGRGGYKLQKALDVTGWRLEGVTAMDIGASTGGFTDCMLQQGAVRVYAVDVGHDHLHEKLRTDSRVINLEGIDIRKTEKIQNFVAESSVLFCSVDVSFIPVEGIFASVLPFLADRARIVCLIKPQFEAGRQAVGKNGVVKDPKAHKQVLHALLAFFAGQRCRLEQLTYSPITGGEGNIEYLAALTYVPGSPVPVNAWDVDGLVEQAHRCLRGRPNN